MRKIGLFVTAFLISSQVVAMDKDVKHFNFVTPVVEEVEVSQAEGLDIMLDLEVQRFEKSLKEVIAIVDGVIALGDKIWKVVEAGRPVSNTNMMSTIDILPLTEQAQPAAFYELTDWYAPKIKKYNVTYKNLYGSKVVNFSFVIVSQAGGKFNGKGAYLTNVALRASSVDVSWGYTVNAESELLGISNTGSKENPVAGATLRLSYNVKTVLKESKVEDYYFVDGLGQISKL